MGKRGISAVVATVLIILITVAGVSVIWLAIIPMINDNLSFEGLDGRVTVVSSGGYTVYDSDREIAIVQVKRDADDGVMERIKIIFTTEGNSESSIVVAPESGQTKTYTFDFAGLDEPDSVSVAPILLNSGGQEKEGSSTSSVDMPSGKISNAGIATYSLGMDYVSEMPTDGLVSWWKLDGDAKDSVGENDGTLSGELVAGFEGNLDNFLFSDCSSVATSEENMEFVDGKIGKAIKLYSNAAIPNPAPCLRKNVGDVKKGDVFWIWAKGEVSMQLWSGSATKSIIEEHLTGKKYDSSYVGSVEEWTLFKIIAKEDTDSAFLYLYSNNGDSTYYDHVWRGPNIVEDSERGMVASFDGVDDYIEVADDDSLDLNDSFSISMWFRVEDLSERTGLIGKYVGGKYNFHTWIKPDSGLTFEIFDGVNDPQASSDTLVNLNGWTHVTFIRDDDSSKMYIYLNGQQNKILSDETAGNSIINNANLTIGTRTENLFFKGRIDEIMIFDRALSEDEVKGLYDLGEK